MVLICVHLLKDGFRGYQEGSLVGRGMTRRIHGNGKANNQEDKLDYGREFLTVYCIYYESYPQLVKLGSLFPR